MLEVGGGGATFGVVMNLVLCITLALWLASSLLLWSRLRKSPALRSDRSERIPLLSQPSE